MAYERQAPITYTRAQAELVEQLLNLAINDPAVRRAIEIDKRSTRIAEGALERTQKALKKREERLANKMERQYPGFKEYVEGGQQKVASAEKPERPKPKSKPTLLWQISK